MAESKESWHRNLREVSEELQHLCINEKDDDDETYHSLEEESNVDEILQERTESKEDIFFPESPEESNKQSFSACADYLADNQCIDEKSASETEVHNSGKSVSDTTSEKRVLYSRNENLSKSASIFSDSDAPVKIIYRRNVESNEQSPGDKSGAANTQPFARSISCTDECPLHNEEVIKYVCITCNKLACQACCTIIHKHCQAAAYIPSFIVKPGFHFEDMCKAFEENLHQIQKRLKWNKEKAQSNLSVCERMKTNAKSQFKQQRDELNRLFDCMERDFNRRMSEMENSGKEKIMAVVAEQEIIENELQKNIQDYNQRKEEGNSSKIFTKIEMSKEIIDDLETDLTRIEKRNNVERYVFTPSKDVLDFQRKVLDLGSIEVINSETKSTITDVKTIDMKTELDRSECKISGLILLSKRHLLAVDFANSAIKVVDLFNDKDVISIPVTPAPFDGTIVNDTQGQNDDVDTVNGKIVLTLPEEKTLRFMDYTLPFTFTAKKDVQTNGMCRAVLYNDGRLFVTFPSQGKIEIIDLEGSLLKRITTDTIGRLFQPLSITMDISEGKLLVSDKDNHAVFCMNIDGDVIATFNDHDLIQPRGLCVNIAGAIFVCSLATHKVYHLSSDFRLISTMPVADDNCPAPYPFSIAFSDENNTMYIGQFAKNCIKVYCLEKVISS